MIRNWVSKFRRWIREKDILEACGAICYCPKCRDPLNDQARWVDPNDGGHGKYKCSKCGNVSEWHFGIAPVPICLVKSL